MTSPTSLVIRPATRADIPALGRLGARLMHVHHEFDRQRFLAPDDDAEAGYGWFLGTQLAQPDAAVLVAVEDDGVVGYVYAAIEPRSWQMLLDEAGVIHDVLVEESAQGHGVASALVEAALAWIASRGVPRVVLHTAEQNERAQQLFTRLGFRRTMVEMTRELDVLAEDESEDAPPTADARDDGEDAAHAAPVRFRLLGEADVVSLVTMDDVIDAMKEALWRFSAGDVVQPVRTVLSVDEGRGFLGLMPARLREPDALGAKLVSVFPGNTALGLPTHSATILLFNPRTGTLVSVMDGRLITEVRTAAVSALSASLLAQDDAAVMAILGSGVQARSHLEAIERVFTLTEVRVWSPTPEHQAAFLDEMEPVASATLVGAHSAEDAVRGADIVVLATSSPEPVVASEWVKDGAHVISVGACRPNQREMDPVLTTRGRLFVDSRAAALVESGDVVMGIAEHRFGASHIAGEIGELIAGTVQGRRSPLEITIFKSLGLAVEDVATAAHVFRRAVLQDVGTELEL